MCELGQAYYAWDPSGNGPPSGLSRCPLQGDSWVRKVGLSKPKGVGLARRAIQGMSGLVLRLGLCKIPDVCLEAPSAASSMERPRPPVSGVGSGGLRSMESVAVVSIAEACWDYSQIPPALQYHLLGKRMGLSWGGSHGDIWLAPGPGGRTRKTSRGCSASWSLLEHLPLWLSGCSMS